MERKPNMTIGEARVSSLSLGESVRWIDVRTIMEPRIPWFHHPLPLAFHSFLKLPPPKTMLIRVPSDQISNALHIRPNSYSCPFSAPLGEHPQTPCFNLRPKGIVLGRWCTQSTCLLIPHSKHQLTRTMRAEEQDAAVESKAVIS